jgi:hypothetical protein
MKFPKWPNAQTWAKRHKFQSNCDASVTRERGGAVAPDRLPARIEEFSDLANASNEDGVRASP